ncbi:MAG: hypothetical protein JZU64_06850 [Rhodoferax sp.]|nr:hypothetical protein [Rhodoferax sp.]
MTLAITTAHNNARLAGTVAYLDTGAANAAVRVYGGTRPATPADAPTSAMLVQVSLTKPCGTVTAGVLTLTQLEDGLITETGIATWARVVNSDGATAFDCDAGQGVGAWEAQLAQTALYAGGGARIASFTLG